LARFLGNPSHLHAKLFLLSHFILHHDKKFSVHLRVPIVLSL
jgi:hypothetical protein